MTLVEVVFASGIAALIALCLLQANLSGRYLVRSSRVQLEAANVLRSYIEQQKNKAYVNIQDTAVNDVTLSDWGTADAGDDIEGDITIDVTDNGNDTKTIVGTITWTQRQMNQDVPRTCSLTTMVANT